MWKLHIQERTINPMFFDQKSKKKQNSLAVESNRQSYKEISQDFYTNVEKKQKN